MTHIPVSSNPERFNEERDNYIGDEHLSVSESANLAEVLLGLVPKNGGTIGNARLRKALSARIGREISDTCYFELRTSFQIDLVSLHVHERIDPTTILAPVKKRAGRVRPLVRRGRV